MQQLSTFTVHQESLGKQIKNTDSCVLLPRDSVSSGLGHGTGVCVLSLGDLMQGSSNLTLRNNGLESMCVYSINEESDACGTLGWCRKIHTRTSKTLPVSVPRGAGTSKENAGRVCTALLRYQTTAAREEQ